MAKPGCSPAPSRWSCRRRGRQCPGSRSERGSRAAPQGSGGVGGGMMSSPGYVITGAGPRTLLRKPLRTCAAFTERERGMRMVFSSITATQDHDVIIKMTTSTMTSSTMTHPGRGSPLCSGRACRDGLRCQTDSSLPTSHRAAHREPTSPQRTLQGRGGGGGEGERGWGGERGVEREGGRERVEGISSSSSD